MSEKDSSQRTPGWLKAAAGIGVSANREPGWLKRAAERTPKGNQRLSEWVRSQREGAGEEDSAEGGEGFKDLSEEQEAARRLAYGAKKYREQREDRDELALDFVFAHHGGYGFYPGDEAMAENTDDAQKFREFREQKYSEYREEGVNEEFLANKGYVLNPDAQGSHDSFAAAGSGRFTATDVDLAKQHYQQAREKEDAYISQDPKKIKAVEEYDPHDFIGPRAGKNLIPKDLENARWGPKGEGMAMIDYSGGQQMERDGGEFKGDIGILESVGLFADKLVGGNSIDSQVRLYRAEDNLRMGLWNDYEENIRKAYEEARIAGRGIPASLEEKYKNLDREKRKFEVRMWAIKYKEGSKVKTPRDYKMPPQPPADLFPEAARAWQDVKWAREFGAEIPYIWEQEWGEPPAPISENWDTWTGVETDPYTGEKKYIGKRDPKHQEGLDKEAREEQERYEESGQKAHDEAAKKYDDTMVDPRQQQLLKFYSTDDPRVREGIQHQWKVKKEYEEINEELKELYKQGEKFDRLVQERQDLQYKIDPASRERFAKIDKLINDARNDNGRVEDRIEELGERSQEIYSKMREHGFYQQDYDYLADKDLALVAERDEKAHDAIAHYYASPTIKDQFDGHEDYVASVLGEEPPEVAEARKRVKERDKNAKALNAQLERAQKFYRQEQDKREQFEDAATLAEIRRNGGLDSESRLEKTVRKAGEDIEMKARKLRRRAHKSALEGRYNEAAELMGRRDLMFKIGKQSLKSGVYKLEGFNEIANVMFDDDKWKAQKEGILATPEFQDLAKQYADNTSKIKEDYIAHYSSEPAQQLEVAKARISRFDRGEAQRRGLEPGNHELGQQPDQAVAENDEPVVLPPQTEEEAVERDKAEKTKADQDVAGVDPEQQEQQPKDNRRYPEGSFPNGPPKVLQEEIATIQQPQPPSTAANNGSGGKSLLDDSGEKKPTNQPTQAVEANNGSGGKSLFDGTGKKKPTNQPTQAVVANNGSGKSLLPDKARPAGDSSATDSTSPVVPPVTPEIPPADVNNTTSGGENQPLDNSSSNPPGSPNAVKKKIPTAGTNNDPNIKKGNLIGNPNAFSGIGQNRQTPDGKKPVDVAKFTVGNEVKTLNTNLFPKKPSPEELERMQRAQQVQQSKKLAHFRGGVILPRKNLKLADFKGARFLRDPGYGDLAETIPLVGGLLEGTMGGLENFDYYTRTGKPLQAAKGLGQFGLSAGLLASSVTPIGGVAGTAGRLAAAGGRSLLGRAAARRAGHATFGDVAKQTAKGVWEPTKRFGTNFGSLRGWGKNTKTIGKGLGSVTGYMAAPGLPSAQRENNFAYIMTPTGQNSSLRGKLNAAAPKTPAKPKSTNIVKPGVSLSIAD